MLKTSRKSRKKIHIGPEDNGRRMSLADFDHAIAQEGYLYELGKGVIEVSDVPHPSHLGQLQSVRNQLIAYQLDHPDLVHTIAGGAEAKLLIGPSESERHPDCLVYLSPPPEVDDDVWSLWVPEIVIEVVSKRSATRDYEDKPPEYLEFGVDEYWIVDGMKRQMTALTRWRGQWKPQVLKSNQKYSTRLLPGFTLDLKKVLGAAK